MFYELEMGYNGIQVFKNICCAKGEGTIYPGAEPDSLGNGAWVSRTSTIR